jgi:hypothetical protein
MAGYPNYSTFLGDVEGFGSDSSPFFRYSIAMPIHPLHGVRFESVACLNPLLEASLLVVCENA